MQQGFFQFDSCLRNRLCLFTQYKGQCFHYLACTGMMVKILERCDCILKMMVLFWHCLSDKDLCNFKTIRCKWTFWSWIASLTICGYLRLWRKANSSCLRLTIGGQNKKLRQAIWVNSFCFHNQRIKHTNRTYIITLMQLFMSWIETRYLTCILFSGMFLLRNSKC